MCSDNPNLPKEANKAKCFVVSCFVLCAAVARPPPRTHGTAPRTPLPLYYDCRHTLSLYATTVRQEKSSYVCVAQWTCGHDTDMDGDTARAHNAHVHIHVRPNCVSVCVCVHDCTMTAL